MKNKFIKKEDKNPLCKCDWCGKKYRLLDSTSPYARWSSCSKNCYWDYMGADSVYDGGGNTY